VRPSVLLIGAAGCFVIAATLSGQLADSAFDREHPAIEYSTRPSHDVVTGLNQALANHSVQLRFEGAQGYLPSVLKALRVLTESQMVVFSKTSVQSPLITPQNPRAIFFNEDVALGWMPGGFIEVAAHDPQQGVVFYVLQQRERNDPSFIRVDKCLGCHDSLATLGVPGFLLRSIPTGPEGETMPWLGNFTTDQRSPFAERWGGWYVTGKTQGIRHLGNRLTSDRNAPVIAGESELTSLRGSIDTSRYPASFSDVVALMVWEHQARMLNLFTRIGWETRLAQVLSDKKTATIAARRITDGISELVDYLMFVDEAPLAGPVQSTSGFVDKFTAQGPRTADGRSLRDFDLRRRMMRYPCSYMIYSAGFNGLPTEAKDAIYRRMWEFLSGRQTGKHGRLSLEDRQAVVEILRETKDGLPDYFKPVGR
jgi:hypothetical protein